MLKKTKMKSSLYLIIPILIIFLIGCITGCDDNLNNWHYSAHTSLVCDEFMNQSYDSIAENLAEILNIAPALFNQKVSQDDRGVSLGWAQWIKEGYEYTTVNGAYITIWVDQNNRPYVITYLLNRLGESGDWSYDQDEANSKIKTVLEQLGVSFDGTETFISEKWSAGQKFRCFNITFNQTFQDNDLTYPYIHAEVGGVTGEITFLKIHRWYTNLSKINKFLSDDKLKEIAVDYYKPRDEDISIDNIKFHGYHIIKDVLCRKIGSIQIDKWGSQLYLFIDIQSGAVIDTEEILVG